jgi:hypothetical protein
MGPHDNQIGIIFASGPQDFAMGFTGRGLDHDALGISYLFGVIATQLFFDPVGVIIV